MPPDEKRGAGLDGDCRSLSAFQEGLPGSGGQGDLVCAVLSPGWVSKHLLGTNSGAPLSTATGGEEEQQLRAEDSRLVSHSPGWVQCGAAVLWACVGGFPCSGL